MFELYGREGLKCRYFYKNPLDSLYFLLQDDDDAEPGVISAGINSGYGVQWYDDDYVSDRMVLLGMQKETFDAIKSCALSYLIQMKMLRKANAEISKRWREIELLTNENEDLRVRVKEMRPGFVKREAQEMKVLEAQHHIDLSAFNASIEYCKGVDCRKSSIKMLVKKNHRTYSILHPQFHKRVPMIYFLFLNGEVVYVGKSTQPWPGRVVQHTDKEYDDAGFIPFPRANGNALAQLELKFIRHFNPKYNIAGKVVAA